MWPQIQRYGNWRAKRGIVAVQAAVMMTALFGFAVLAIDVGYICTRRSEMQNAVDSGALAGASGLQVSQSVARSRARTYAGANSLGREPVVVTGADVEIGNWQGVTATFTPFSIDDALGSAPNAVRVQGRKDPLALFFASVFGFRHTSVFRDAIAVADGGRCRGIWGLEGVFGSGSLVTDSYDSRDGAYGAGNRHQNGDLCSNRDIFLEGGVQIHGDAMYGPGYDIDILGVSYQIWGVIGSTCCEVEPPVVDAIGASITNDNDIIGIAQDGYIDGTAIPALSPSGGLLVDGSRTLSFYPGTYYVTSAEVVGSATVRILGPDPTIIYIDGNARFAGGGIINVTADPHNLIIYSTGPTIELTGESSFYGAIIAPEAVVRLPGTTDVYGTIIGRIVDIEGESIIHVDESLLADLFGGDGQVVPVLVE